MILQINLTGIQGSVKPGPRGREKERRGLESFTCPFPSDVAGDKEGNSSNKGSCSQEGTQHHDSITSPARKSMVSPLLFTA